MQKLWLSFILFFTLCFSAYSQSFYTVADNSVIRRETITSTGITRKVLSSCVSGALSIAVFNTTMFITTYSGSIYKATITDDALVNCTGVVSAGNMNALTVSKSGKLYMASSSGTQLYLYDPAISGGVTLLGNMPDASSGDLIFFRDDLYMAGTKGIYKINLANPMLSTLEIPTNGQAFYGLVSVRDDNYKIHIYGLRINSGTDLIELDLDKKQVLNTPYNLPYSVYDGASDAEIGGPPLIRIDKIDILQECNYYNKGYIEVTSGQHTEVYTYTLNTGETNTTGLFNNLIPGTYKLTVSTTTDVPPVEEDLVIPDYSLNKPKTTYKTNIPVCDLQGTVQLTVKGASTTYSIKYGNEVYPANHVFNIFPDFYRFIILDQNNCIVDDINLNLTKVGPCSPVTFPNTFTPNGDGINDVFRPSQDSRATKYQLHIFNRYGALLFISKDLALGWDGMSQGKAMPTGTYYWMVTYVDINGKPDTQKGFVSILK
jgi:gliding motility-associated-like protein